jgi:hypothetical protein
VADPSAGWLDAWAGRLRRCGASHVRAPHTAVPLPAPLTLRSFAERTRRTAELAASSPRFVAVPSLALYADGCADALRRMPAARARVRRGTVTRLVRRGRRSRRASRAHAAVTRAESGERRGTAGADAADRRPARALRRRQQRGGGAGAPLPRAGGAQR